eukprot:COSAG06_NODE_40876_length_397_cov_1.255034_1_plen_29_part_01
MISCGGPALELVLVAVLELVREVVVVRLL